MNNIIYFISELLLVFVLIAIPTLLIIIIITIYKASRGDFDDIDY